MTTVEMLETFDDLDLRSFDGPLAERLAGLLRGPNPYVGTLPWSFQFQVHENRLDDLYFASARDESGNVLLQLASSSRFPTVDLILAYMAQMMKMERFPTVRDMNFRIANVGYRMFVMSTGASRGHINTTTVVAERISEIDAALQLDSDLESILDLLDDGADVLRVHPRFGSPYIVALGIEKIRNEYSEVVEYMRALGAYSADT